MYCIHLKVHSIYWLIETFTNCLETSVVILHVVKKFSLYLTFVTVYHKYFISCPQFTVHYYLNIFNYNPDLCLCLLIIYVEMYNLFTEIL